MTKEELAALLNGREYGNEITRDERVAAKKAGLVVVFGASDDLMEMHGAIDEELGAYEGYVAKVDGRGLIPAFEELIESSEPPDVLKNKLRDYFRREDGGFDVEAVWDPGDGYSWVIKTDIPHATFEIVEGDAKFCRGVVFALADITP